MPSYAVALWVKYSDGNEDRYDTTVDADGKTEAKSIAANELPSGTKVQKVIYVEER